MTQDLYQQAIKFAGEKHRDQKVPGTNSNYLLHLSNVAMEIMLAHAANTNFDLDYAVQLALLHDTLEDTETMFAELAAKFGEKIALGVQALTKDETFGSKQESMIDSLTRINQLENEVGMVKIADRITNLQKPPEHWNNDKRKYYLEEAKLINKILNQKNAYLIDRLQSKIVEYQQYIR